MNAFSPNFILFIIVFAVAASTVLHGVFSGLGIAVTVAIAGAFVYFYNKDETIYPPSKVTHKEPDYETVENPDGVSYGEHFPISPGPNHIHMIDNGDNTCQAYIFKADKDAWFIIDDCNK